WSEPLRSAVGELARGWGAAAEFLSNGSSPAPSASVCLEAARAGEVQLNLLPDEWRVQRRSAKRRRTIIRSAIALGAIYVLALAVFLSAVVVEKTRARGLNRRILSLQREYNEARTLHKTLVAVQK